MRKRVAADISKKQFYFNFGDRTSFRAKGSPPKLWNRTLPQFFSFWRLNFISCEKGLPRTFQKAILFQTLAIEPHFVRKGRRRSCEVVILLQFLRSNLISCERVVADTSKAQFYFSLWRSNLISCERVAAEVVKSKFYHSFLVFGDRTSLRAKKGCRGSCEIAIVFSFGRSPHFMRRGAAEVVKS